MLLILLGAWAFFVPLLGPYFGFAFFTDNAWTFTGRHWELLLAPGIVIAFGGLLMTMPAKSVAWLGSLVALVAGVWLLVGPSLYSLWTPGVHPRVLVPHSEALHALLWIGYFYGSGALAVWLTAHTQGMLSRRTVVEDRHVVIEETPIREPAVEHVERV